VGYRRKFAQSGRPAHEEDTTHRLQPKKNFVFVFSESGFPLKSFGPHILDRSAMLTQSSGSNKND
jgi:hypothetical protein